MRWSELEHVIRAAGTIAGVDELVVVGTAALLGSVRAPADEVLTRSQEVDLYPLHSPELAELIDGCIGEGSPFHDTFGYYAHGVGPETAVLPVDWQQRLLSIQTPGMEGRTAIFPELHDLALSKLHANRPKDRAFVLGMLHAELLEPDELQARCLQMPLNSEGKAALASRVDGLLAQLAARGGGAD